MLRKTVEQAVLRAGAIWAGLLKPDYESPNGYEQIVADEVYRALEKLLKERGVNLQSQATKEA